MSLASVVLLLAATVPGSASVAGHVIDAGGAPIPGAQVWLEPGIAANLASAKVGEDGAFAFRNVSP
ncbi:MAG TPA: carboxypeptidase regulatory-like domain-containing protein, partial [Candidatus Hydrogenedentes bacterium]|nr:carboxypeptidase regulatory-like domain-containing protein [Candidatus Hydrogenedentota bacterium]